MFGLATYLWPAGHVVHVEHMMVMLHVRLVGDPVERSPKLLGPYQRWLILNNDLVAEPKLELVGSYYAHAYDQLVSTLLRAPIIAIITH